MEKGTQIEIGIDTEIEREEGESKKRTVEPLDGGHIKSGQLSEQILGVKTSDEFSQ